MISQLLRCVILYIGTILACGCAHAETKNDFPFNARTAIWFANEIAIDLAKHFPERGIDPKNLDFGHAITMSIVDGHGRRFVMVAAQNTNDESRGFQVVFEICGSDAELLVHFAPVVYSPIGNVIKELNDFNYHRGSLTSDLPHGCPKSID